MINRKRYLKCSLFLFLAAVVMAAWMVQPSMADYLVTPNAYWQLDENGGSFADKTSTVSGAACINCPALVDPSQIGAGQLFDSTEFDTISIPSNPVFDFAAGTSFSIELWMKLASPPDSRQVMIGRDDSSNSTHWWLSVENDGTVGVFFTDMDGPFPTLLSGTSNVANDGWHHIVAVRNGAADRISLYIDGVREATQDQSGVLDTSTDQSFVSTADLTMGSLSSGFWYGGSLDEVAIYSTALTATMVRQHFNAETDQYYCNGSPTINSTAVQTATEGVAYTYTATATDPEGHDVTWSLLTAPTGMTINATSGQVIWTPGGNVASAGVEILATDTYGATGTQPFTIAVTLVNDAPVITGQGAMVTLEDTDLTIALSDLTVTDPDNPSYPTGFSLQVLSGTNYTLIGATITPAADFSGTLDVQVTVNDGVANSAPYMLQVTVSAVNDPPVITTTAPTSATVGSAYNYIASGMDIESNSLTWSLSGAPTGMIVDAATGQVSWTPAAGSEGDVTYSLMASDGNGGTDTEAVTVTVSSSVAPASTGSSGGGGGGGGCFIETASSGRGNAAGMMLITALLSAALIVSATEWSGHNKR